MDAKRRAATWVTREHVFVDRVACPWLIRKFVDRDAQFEFVPWDASPADIEASGKIPFDMEGCRYGHRLLPDGEELCTFEVLMEEFGLRGDEALRLVAEVVHAADVEKDLDRSREGRGLKAISWGWRFNFLDDHEAIREGEKIYDALYTWANVQVLNERNRDKIKMMDSRERYDYLRSLLNR